MSENDLEICRQATRRGQATSLGPHEMKGLMLMILDRLEALVPAMDRMSRAQDAMAARLAEVEAEVDLCVPHGDREDRLDTEADLMAVTRRRDRDKAWEKLQEREP